MDPNETLRRIIAMADKFNDPHTPATEEDRDEWRELFDALFGWLARGGFAPKCSTLGTGKRAVGYAGQMRGALPKREDFAREWLQCPIDGGSVLVLMSTAPGATTYQAVKYGHGETADATYPFPA